MSPTAPNDPQGATPVQINAVLANRGYLTGIGASAAGFGPPWLRALDQGAQSQGNAVGLAAIQRALNGGATPAQVNAALANRGYTVGQRAKDAGFGV